MSYTVTPYIIDLSAVIAAFGSHDAELEAILTEDWVEEIGDNAWDFSKEIAQGAPTLVQAVHELIEGTIQLPDAAWQYGYALELLCRHFGEPLPNPAFEEFRSYAIGYFDEIDGLRPLNLGSRLPLPLPPPEDFPAISYLTADEVKAAMETRQSFGKSNEDGEWKASAEQEYHSWLETAAARETDLIFFLY